MKARAISATVTMIIALLFGWTDEARAAQTEIWLGGVDPVVQNDRHVGEPADFMQMFTPDAPWSTAASKLTAFKISTQFVLRGSDDQLRTFLSDLQRRHIGVALELGTLVLSERCGFHVEGYASPRGVEAAAKRIKSVGGVLDYVAMDEPVWFGHIFTSGSGGRVGCQDPITDLADQVAPKLAILREYFPNVQIGDVEPVNARKPEFIRDIITFVDAIRQKTGMSFAFVHADIAWSTNWQPMLQELAMQLRGRGIRFGVICDGDVNAGGNEAWVDQAVQRCTSIAANPSTRPDDFIVQSWEPLPTKMLPESDPGSLTYEVLKVDRLLH